MCSGALERGEGVLEAVKKNGVTGIVEVKRWWREM